LFDDVPV
jgi:hypothetical protein